MPKHIASLYLCIVAMSTVFFSYILIIDDYKYMYNTLNMLQ